LLKNEANAKILPLLSPICLAVAPSRPFTFGYTDKEGGAA
jgi:hypothetical protein